MIHFLGIRLSEPKKFPSFVIKDTVTLEQLCTLSLPYVTLDPKEERDLRRQLGYFFVSQADKSINMILSG